MDGGCLLIAPHPDDETIGAGIWMKRHGPRGLTILHLTNGSPRDMQDAHQEGFSSAREYAAARREELLEAMSSIGLSRAQCLRFRFTDQELYLSLPSLIRQLRRLIQRMQPSLVLAPPYEGGHPDHDSAALAIALARRAASPPFRHREYRLYHAAPDGSFETREFLPAPQSQVEVLPLTAEERESKRRMIASFRTQQRVLQQFGIEDEQFRDAPDYDFERPPHEGALLYEQRNWGITGAAWRAQAREALARAALF